MTIADAIPAEKGEGPHSAVNRGDMDRIVSAVRQDLARGGCPSEFVRIACDSIERAVGGMTRVAEARERKRIIRWLRTVADVYAARLHVGKGEDSAYWSDHLKAFSQAADGISRRRHDAPH